MPTDDLPPLPEGFKRCSGKRSPPRDGTKYHVQFRSGYIDLKHTYEAAHLVWTHEGHEWDVIAVRAA